MGDSMSTIINATTTNGVVIQPDNSGSLQLATNNGTTAVTISTSQNVGIGTSSFVFSNRLIVKQSADNSANGLGFRIERNANDSSLFLGYRDNTDTWQINATYGSTGAFKPITFSTSDTERMRIDSSGNVGIGATTLTAKLHVVSDGATTIPMRNNNTETGTASSNSMAFQRSGTTVGLISVTGSNTTYGTSSDYRLKENILPMTGALDTVAQLKPVTYKWKADGSDGQGFIAHELQSIVPDCVVGEKDAVETYTDEEGNEQTRIKPQGIDTSFLVATLTAAIQEQQTIINDLKARIETLEAK
jgi:hypothetical protein